MTQTIFPTLRYRDAKGAIEFLTGTLGFEKVAVYEGDGDLIDHAELSFGGDVVMLGSDRSPSEERHTTAHHVTYIAIDDVEALHARVREAGGEPTDLVDQDYGSRDFSIEDPGGNTWSFGTYRPNAAG